MTDTNQEVRETPESHIGEYVLVPREPTQAMKDAAWRSWYGGKVNAHDYYRAMLAAAPQPPLASAPPPAVPDELWATDLLGLAEIVVEAVQDTFDDGWQPVDAVEPVAEVLRRSLLVAPPPAVPDAVGVRVKGLDWRKPDGAETLLRADTIVGTYRTWTHHEANGEWYWEVHALNGDVERGEGPTEDSVQAAAQADFDSRILSSIEPTPSPEPQASNAGAVDAWRDMASALRDASEIVLRIPCQGWPDHYAQIGHWAEDMSGEEQPPFRGWFRKTGYGCAELNEPTGWMPLSSSNATLATPEPQTGERDGEAVAAFKAEMVEDEKVLAYWVEQAVAEKKRADEAERRLAEEYANMDATMLGWDELCAKSDAAETAAEARAEAAERRLAEVEERAREDERDRLLDATEHVHAPPYRVALRLFLREHGAMEPADRAALRAKPEAHTLVGKEDRS